MLYMASTMCVAFKRLHLAMVVLFSGGAALGGWMIMRPASARWPAADLGCPRCPVVLISVDTLRADHLGCYGYARPTTPT